MTDQELYQTGKLIDLCFEISKMITSEPAIEQAFRYSKVVDYSAKGFDCPSAKAIKHLMAVSEKTDPKFAASVKKLESIRDRIDNIIKQKEV